MSDLEALARDTHKFESRYLERIIGPYPACADIYRMRSAICAAERSSCPVIFSKAWRTRSCLRTRRSVWLLLCARKDYRSPVAFEGAQHGFPQAHNIKRTLDVELYFYSRVYDLNCLSPLSL